MFLLLGIAVQQDDGVIHGKHQLHNTHNGIGVIGNGGEENVGAQVDGYRNADIDHENDRLKPGIAHHQQDQQHEADGHDDDVQGENGHVGFVNLPAGNNAAAVIPVMYGAVQGGGFRRMAVEFRCDFIEGVTVPVILFPGFPSDFRNLLQAGKP